MCVYVRCDVVAMPAVLRAENICEERARVSAQGGDLACLGVVGLTVNISL